MSKIYSYVVRYDSGFAPNPFYNYCTLATCKPPIRKSASVGDWILGSGSNDRKVRQGGRLVYAMRVSEIMSFDDYSRDDRFQVKKPYRNGSRKQSCGDNIYHRETPLSKWNQLDSFHSDNFGQLNPDHVRRDTAVNRVLISDHYVYFGGQGPKIPKELVDSKGRSICKSGVGFTAFNDLPLLTSFEQWLESLGVNGYQGAPFEWLSLRTSQ